MNRKFKQKIKLGIIIITSFLNTSAALANNIESIPSVSKLKNIHTKDWEYQALQSLAQRYNCTSQWQNDETSPQVSDRSNSPITRYEFAVGLNNCLQKLDNITISQQDIIILQRLQQDFAQELARLTTKVAELETNITQLESQQFSTTTKFNGQALFFLTDSFGGEDNAQTTFGYRTRLIF